MRSSDLNFFSVFFFLFVVGKLSLVWFVPLECLLVLIRVDECDHDRAGRFVLGSVFVVVAVVVVWNDGMGFVVCVLLAVPKWVWRCCCEI